MKLEDRLEKLLRSPEPAQALREWVIEQVQQGQTQATIYSLLEKMLLAVRSQPDLRDSEEDLILDVMDMLTGWCHPDSAFETVRKKDLSQ